MFRFASAVAIVGLMALGVYGGAVLFFPGLVPMVTGLGSVSNVPSAINHQGVVTVSGKRFTGTGSFKFAIVDPDTGNNVWTNDGSRMSPPAQTGEPDNGVSLTVTDGMYSVALGGGSMTAISPGLFADGNLVLRIWFNDGTHNWQQLSPDHTLTSVPYAMAIADQAVTSVKLASGVAIPPGAILMWSGSTTDIPAGWTLCNGQNGTPDLRNRFVVGAGDSYTVNNTGGSNTAIVPGHMHSKGTLGTDTFVAASTDILRWCGVGCTGDRYGATGSDWRGGLNVNHSHAITGTVGNTASTCNGDNDISIENRPPYYALCYIMKTAY